MKREHTAYTCLTLESGARELSKYSNSILTSYLASMLSSAASACVPSQNRLLPLLLKDANEAIAPQHRAAIKSETIVAR